MDKRPPTAQVDPIRLQIEALQEQLRPPRPLAERITESCPLMPSACGLIAGLILQRQWNLPFTFWAVVLPLLMGSLYFVLRRSTPRQKQIALLWISLFAGVLLGAVRLRLFQTPCPDDIRRRISGDSSLAALGGTILSQPRLEDRSQWVFARYQWTDPGTSFLFRIEEALTQSGWEPASGTIYAVISEPVRTFSSGDRIRFYARLKSPRPPDNPGMFDGKQSLENQGIFLTAEIPGMASIELHEKNHGGLWACLIERFRAWAFETLSAFGGDQKESSALPETLLLGKRTSLDTRTWTAFRKTGLAHFISLSGMHVGILSGIFWWIGRTAGLKKPSRALLCILLIGLYAVVVPPRAPTLRAVFLAEFIFFSILLNRRAKPLNTLALTALILLLIRPSELFQAGWQLSYATVLGILLLYEPIFNRLAWPLFTVPKITDWLFAIPGGSILWTVLQSALKLLAVGLSAWLGGAGILLWHFGTITPLSAFWTVLVFPLVFLILLTGFMKLLLVPLLPTMAALCSVWLDVLSDLFIRIVTGLAQWDILALTVGRAALWVILLYYAWLLGICLMPPRRKSRQFLAAFGVLVILFSVAAAKLQRSFSKDLTLTCLSVGHGLAVVGQLPGGRTFLFDGGSISVKNPGSRILVPYLNYRGIDTLDAVILSHGDLDHYNGLPEVMESIRVKSIYVNPGFLDKALTSSAAGKMKSILQTNGPIGSTADLPPVFGDVQMKPLWPDTLTAVDKSVSDNDKSEVFLIEYAGRSVLLCGDIEDYAQRTLLERYPDLNVDVLLLPHHGSRNNILPLWIRQLNSNIRVVSCARTRLKNVAALNDPGTNWYTPVHGAVTITIKADGTLDAVGFLNPH